MAVTQRCWYLDASDMTVEIYINGKIWYRHEWQDDTKESWPLQARTQHRELKIESIVRQLRELVHRYMKPDAYEIYVIYESKMKSDDKTCQEF